MQDQYKYYGVGVRAIKAAGGGGGGGGGGGWVRGQFCDFPICLVISISNISNFISSLTKHSGYEGVTPQ